MPDRELEVFAPAPSTRDACLDGGHRQLGERARRVEGVDDESIADLCGHLGHPRTDSGQNDAGHPVRVGAGVEDRCHQGVGVEFAAKIEPAVGVPAAPLLAQRQDVLPHPRRRFRPRHAEAFFDVRADLRAEPEGETAARVGVQVVRDVRHGHRAARQCDRHARRQFDALGVFGRDQQREERVVLTFEREETVEAELFHCAGTRRNGIERVNE